MHIHDKLCALPLVLCGRDRIQPTATLRFYLLLKILPPSLPWSEQEEGCSACPDSSGKADWVSVDRFSVWAEVSKGSKGSCL